MKKKVLLFSLMMAAMMALPMSMSAQGLFGQKDQKEMDTQEMSENNQKTENRGPLGSGLLIMAAAGAGYAYFKKKED